MIRKVEMERFSVTSSKPFDAVVAAIKASIGHPNMAEFWQTTQRATTAAKLEVAIQAVLGESGLMQFVEFDHGMIVRKGTEHHTSRIIRLVIGNPLIMKEMAKRVPDAGSYAPVTVLVDERADGVHISYDRMASLLTPYGDRDALSIARDLDAKVGSFVSTKLRSCRTVNSSSRSVTGAWGCRWRRWIKSFLRSLPPNRRAAAWGWPSAAP
jgi:uncharacterized protein (DUF302 family)